MDHQHGECHRDNVEVCSHRRHKGSAVACSQSKCTDNNRVCTLGDQKRDTDADDDDRESSEAVAHDHGEESHGDAVYGGCGKQVIGRDHGADTVCDDVTDTGCREQGAEGSENLRQNAGYADIVYQTGSVGHCVGRSGLEKQQCHDQCNGTGDTDGVVGAEYF